MATIRKRAENALENLSLEKLRVAQDLLPAIERAQEMMRHVQIDSVRPLLELARQQDELLRQASDALKYTAPVFEATKQLTAVSDALKDALCVDSALANATKAMTVSADAMRAAQQVDSAMHEVARTVTLAGDVAAATMNVMRADLQAIDWAKAMTAQIDVARPVAEALQRAVPEFHKFVLDPDVQQAMERFSAINIAPQIATVLEPAAGLAAVMRDVAKLQASFDMPALLQVQRIAASIASSMPRVGDIDPARYGVVFAEGETEAAWLRFMAKAEAIAANKSGGPEAVIELAEDADALTTAAPPESRLTAALLVRMVLVALAVDLLSDGIKAGGTKLLPYIVALPMLFQPAPLPSLPPAPPSIRAPMSLPSGAAGLARSWEVEGWPAMIRRAGPEAERRTLDFFEGIRSSNTRMAYRQAVNRFMTWCDDRNLELTDVTAFTVNAYVIEMSRAYAPRSVRQHLGAIRGLFDHLTAGKVVPLNPASQVRGPKDEARAAKPTPIRPQEIGLLLDSIDADNTGLRDRAVIAAMAFGFARVSAVVAMDVKDYFERDGQHWLRLRERGGRMQDVTAHSKAREYLDAYIDVAGIAGQPESPLWRTITKERSFSGERMSRVDAFRMVKRRLHDAGLDEAANCDSIRAAGIASYPGSGAPGATVQTEPGRGTTAVEIERNRI